MVKRLRPDIKVEGPIQVSEGRPLPSPSFPRWSALMREPPPGTTSPPRTHKLSHPSLSTHSHPPTHPHPTHTPASPLCSPHCPFPLPVQYDAAIDPAVAAVKVKAHSEVAGKATVFIFPDLNTGDADGGIQEAGRAVACTKRFPLTLMDLLYNRGFCAWRASVQA